MAMAAKVECLDGAIYRLLHSVWLRLLRHSEGYWPGPEALFADQKVWDMHMLAIP